MAATLAPLAVWDCSDPGWWHRRQGKEDWLRDHGVPIAPDSYTYRVEFHLLDTPFARVFSYHVNEHGRRHLPASHDPGQPHDHSRCEPVKNPPRDIPLRELPPEELR